MSDSTPSTQPLAASPRTTVERIVHWQEWMPGLFSFRLSRPAGFDFTPGQFARIGITLDSGETIWRAFSLASAPRHDHLEFYAVVVEQGTFTPLLDQRRIGAEVQVEKPAQGFLTADRLWRGEGSKDLWMLATGTGLGPFIAMLDDPAVWQHFDKLVLVHSVRHASELGYRAQLDAWVANPPHPGPGRLVYLPTLTRDPGTPHAWGRITDLIEQDRLAGLAGVPLDPSRSRFMLCGNPAMVETSRGLLKVRGFTNDRKLTPGHIVVENYW